MRNNIYYSKTPAPITASEMDAIPERLFLKDMEDSTMLMMERLTTEEQMRVSFVPLIITRLAWVYADKAMTCAARDRVSLLKKLCRELKQVKQDYEREIRRELDYSHVKNVEEQTDMCIDEMGRDLQILYFSVNQEFKRSVPEYPYDELRTYAIISVLFVDYLQSYNRDIDRLLAVKLRDRHLSESIVPPLIEKLRHIMRGFAGIEDKFNFNDRNVTLAMAVIKNRINSIEFSISD